MKFIGIDVGKKRVGVASCDRLEMVSSPHSVIPVDGKTFEKIKKLVEDEEVDGVVIGLPLSMDGQERDACSEVRDFITKLKPLIKVPIHEMDERLTTKIAESSLIESGMRREKRKEIRDAVAASLILRTFIERRRFDRENSSKPTNQIDEG
ncbi:MAG: Holliday junction resolvase RuvX [Candidatus Riflebacteria bacterium]|nr:Holliday junction resolvase RuvX [Candidatus Riflebacteria bacterium]